MDGKQARRTGSSSPLGELFDHGCDAISMVVVITGAAVTLKLGQLPHWMVTVSVGASVMFYLTHWRAYVSGVVRFGRQVYLDKNTEWANDLLSSNPSFVAFFCFRIDVTELQILGVFIFFLTGFCGQDIFLANVSLC